jgi:hypothetical protein
MQHTPPHASVTHESNEAGARPCARAHSTISHTTAPKQIAQRERSIRRDTAARHQQRAHTTHTTELVRAPTYEIAQIQPHPLTGMAYDGIFEPFRALGLVCSDVQPVLNTLGEEMFVAVAVDRSFVVYGADNLATRMVSPPLRKRIRCVAVSRCGCHCVVAGAACLKRRGVMCCAGPHARAVPWSTARRAPCVTAVSTSCPAPSSPVHLPWC